MGSARQTRAKSRECGNCLYGMIKLSDGKMCQIYCGNLIGSRCYYTYACLGYTSDKTKIIQYYCPDRISLAHTNQIWPNPAHASNDYLVYSRLDNRLIFLLNFENSEICLNIYVGDTSIVYKPQADPTGRKFISGTLHPGGHLFCIRR